MISTAPFGGCPFRLAAASLCVHAGLPEQAVVAAAAAYPDRRLPALLRRLNVLSLRHGGPRVYGLAIGGWRPALDNELVGRHRMTGHRLKSADRRQVGTAALAFGVPKARGPRHVTLIVTNRYRSTVPDPTAPWKSLLDALVRNGLLVDDDAAHCSKDDPLYLRGPKGTAIFLEELE